MSIKQLSITEAKAIMAKRPVTLVDIRDQQAFLEEHIEGALHVHSQNVQDFIAATDLDQAVIVYCYHGHSSISAANYLYEQGFEEVYSLQGGYELWRNHQDN